MIVRCEKCLLLVENNVCTSPVFHGREENNTGLEQHVGERVNF